MTIYDVFFFVFAMIYLPYLLVKGKAHKNFGQRFGWLGPLFKSQAASRPIWIHAVSVGEVLAVKNFTEEIHTRFPGEKIILSTTTKTGNDVAGKILREDILKFYFPLDFSFVINRVINLINPSILILMETELWPNLISELSRRNVPIALINGRISDRSFRRYEKIRFFFDKVLKRVNLFCMQSAEDAERINALGAPQANVKITGNMKFDIKTDVHPWGGHRMDIGESEELLIAGSTHGGEEEILLDVYKELIKEFQNLRLLIAPRHIDRARTVKKLAEQMGLKGILVLDTLGELARLYSLAAIVFMGGSLVKRGGHNILEPAVFGKPIVFGHYMFNFRDIARSFLENKAAIEVKNREELLRILGMLLKDRNKRSILGRNAKELIDKSKGATERNIRELEKFICK